MLCDGFTYFSQRVGVTATLPHSVPRYLPITEAGSDEWYYCGNSLYHNQSYTEFPNIPSLNDLSIHLVKDRGEGFTCIAVTIAMESVLKYHLLTKPVISIQHIKL